ncbi:cyclophilin-like fold protein [Clostridium sp. AUH-JLR23]|uniref:cyclophilin-like fold protein n=1 Tax=Clostridium sp. AUH-JLR23 TaxID=1505062 RepID=UPI003561EFF3
MMIQFGEKTLKALLVDNSSTKALKEKLQNGSITIEMEDYASMEKVGDLILYLGHMFVIYYRPNTWNFTQLGQIQGISKSELMKILGQGNVTVTLSLDEEN